MNVGVLVNDREIDRWQADALERLLAESDAEIELVVENARSRGVGFYLDHLVNDGLWALNGMVRLTKRRLGREPAYRDQVPLDEVVDRDTTHHIRCAPIPSDGLGVELPDDVVETVSERTDVLVRYGFGILTGDVLTAPTHGVLSYHHGDIRAYRGRPPGFWEFVHGVPTAGITVQRLTETLDGGYIAAEKAVDISDCDTWQEVTYRLFTNSSDLLPKAVDNMTAGRVQEVEELGPLYTSPTASEYLQYLWKNWVR